MLFDPDKPFNTCLDQDGHHFDVRLTWMGNGYNCEIHDHGVLVDQGSADWPVDEAKRKAAGRLEQVMKTHNIIPPDKLAERLKWTQPDDRPNGTFAWVPSAGSARL